MKQLPYELLNNKPGEIQTYIKAGTADNTRKAYRSAIRQFEKWGGRLPTNQETVIRYAIDQANVLNPRSLDLHMTALSQWHHFQGLPDPVRTPQVNKVMDGIRRTHGVPKQKAKALRLEHIAKIINYLNKLPDTPKKFRDTALVLTGFFGAFRRSELISICVHHLIWEPEGLLVEIQQSKSDQTSQGLLRALPYGEGGTCAASAIKTWLSISGITEGVVFRPINRWGHIQPQQLHPSAIGNLLKNLGAACHFDFYHELSSHSFRRGLSTSAARENIEFDLIKKQGGWKTDAIVREYIEEGKLFTHNVTPELMEKLARLIRTTNSN